MVSSRPGGLTSTLVVLLSSLPSVHSAACRSSGRIPRKISIKSFSSKEGADPAPMPASRRHTMASMGSAGLLSLLMSSRHARADPRQGGDREGLTARGPNNVFAEGRTLLCDGDCEKLLEKSPLVETRSGLSYRDIVVGTGPKPPKGYQVTTNAVMMVADEKGELQPFVNSLARGFPMEFRIGTGSTIKGIDEGVSAMRLGGIRRLYIPAELSFPNGVRSDSRAPQVPPRTPIVVDVQLAYISGLDMEDEDVE
mmetsp:Transcript_42/g.83  ORF Transcript_42/g.83 Transcript_42/m.83 type:complete len:253 (+) Transcript_42:25-783(+)